MYVVSSAPDDDCIIICINLVMMMGWVDEYKFFCALSETLTDTADALLDTDLTILAYGVISKITSTGSPPYHTCESLTHIYCYMNDVISAVQGGP